MARSQTIRECTAARDKGQTLRVDGHWLDARRTLRGCAADVCPIAMRSECQSWIGELNGSIPSVVFVVEGGAHEASTVRIFVDGETDVERAYPTEEPIELEPGEHQFRVEVPSHPTQSFSLTLNEGQRHRLVRVNFAEEKPHTPQQEAANSEPTTEVALASKAEPMSAPADSSGRTPQTATPWLSYGLGLGAIVGVASATGIYVAAKSELDSARQTCAPLCGRDDRRSIERMFLLGDAVALTSLVLGVAAVYFYESGPDATTGQQSPSLSLALGRRSAGLWLGHAF